MDDGDGSGPELGRCERWVFALRGCSASRRHLPTPASPTGYKLGLLATACWMGGVWSDAEGAPPASWRDRDDQRCRDMVNAVYGAFSQARYEQIRENEAPVIPGGITGTRTVLRADQ